MLADIADVVIEVYAIESTLTRTEKLHAARGPDTAAAALDITRVFVSDAADRMVHLARQVIRALNGHAAEQDEVRLKPDATYDEVRLEPDATDDFRRGRAASLADLVAPIASFDGVDGVAARRRISDAVVEAGRHPF